MGIESEITDFAGRKTGLFKPVWLEENLIDQTTRLHREKPFFRGRRISRKTGKRYTFPEHFSVRDHFYKSMNRISNLMKIFMHCVSQITITLSFFVTIIFDYKLFTPSQSL
jgi:hypothetical protein